MSKYKVVYDIGKPYETEYSSDKELAKGMKDFYIQNKDNGGYLDCKVYNETGEDISDSQFIQEIVANIIE